MAIEKGQTVGLIEVMKTFSPVRADLRGAGGLGEGRWGWCDRGSVNRMGSTFLISW